MMKTLKLHPELEQLLPPLSEAEMNGLEADLLARGCITPIVVWNDYVLDGHHRYKICTRYEISFETCELQFESLDEAKLWAWTHQENRRNLTPFQKAEIALQFKPILASKGKQNMVAGGGDQKSEQAKSGLSTLANPINEKNTRHELAKIAGVSHGTMHKAEFIQNNADEETKERLRSGETTINREFSRLKNEAKPEKSKSEKTSPLPEVSDNWPDDEESQQEPIPVCQPEVIYGDCKTLEHIGTEDPESLITCLFRLFDASFREKLVCDLLAGMKQRNETTE